MKKSLFYAVLFCLTCLFTSCGEDEVPVGTTSKMRLNFEAIYGRVPLDLVNNTEHNYVADTAIRFSKFRFFISEVVLYRDGETDKTMLREVGNIDFSKSNQDSIFVLSVPTGDYSGLKFTVGANEELNMTAPDDYSSEHPLSDTSNYWQSMSGYIHCHLEGFLTPADMTDEVPFSYKTGSNDMLRYVTIPYNFTLEEDGDLNLDIMVDAKALLFENGVSWDIQRFPVIDDFSDPDQLNTATYIMNNFETAFSIE